MILIIEERVEHAKGLKKDFAAKKDVHIVTTRLAAVIRLAGKDRQVYQKVFYNGMELLGTAVDKLIQTTVEGDDVLLK